MIAWTDVETTGLDETKGDLLEIAIVVTDDQLNEVASASTVIRPPVSLDATIAKMDPYVKDMHTKNGLIDELRNLAPAPPSDKSELERVSEWFESEMIAAFRNLPVVMTDKCVKCKLGLSSHKWNGSTKAAVPVCPSSAGSNANDEAFVPRFDTPISQTPLAGSTVGFDRRWLKFHVPMLEALFSYRSIDVSSITELAKRFAPQVYGARPKAANAHRALADVRESIAYLKYYRESGFIGGK